MPSREEHLTQAARNQKLAETLSKTDYLDWAVTVYFYAAVHLIESYLAIHGHHCDDHAERNRHMAQIPQLRAIYKEYQTLRTLSRQARYHAQPVKTGDLKIAQESLSTIHAQIRYVTTGKKTAD